MSPRTQKPPSFLNGRRLFQELVSRPNWAIGGKGNRSGRWSRTQWSLWQSSRVPMWRWKNLSEGQPSLQHSNNQAFMVEWPDRRQSSVKGTWQPVWSLPKAPKDSQIPDVLNGIEISLLAKSEHWHSCLAVNHAQNEQYGWWHCHAGESCQDEPAGRVRHEGGRCLPCNAQRWDCLQWQQAQSDDAVIHRPRPRWTLHLQIDPAPEYRPRCNAHSFDIKRQSDHHTWGDKTVTR